MSDVDDTHPVLRDRLEALDEKAVPAWSAKSALGLLADKAKWIAHFDGEWRRAHTNDWKQHHAYLARVRDRAAALAASAGRNNADEMVEWADCERRIDPAVDVRGHYERALQITADHPGALRGLAQTLPATDRAARLVVLERLHTSSAASGWWAAKTAVALLENPDAGPHDEAALKYWRERTRTAEAAEQRAWEEITATPFFSQIARHDLSDFELCELRADLVRRAAVSRAWLVRKNLREFPWRRAYVLFVELPSLADEERWQLCRELEHTLTLPGAVLVLWAGHSPTLAEIERQAFDRSGRAPPVDRRPWLRQWGMHPKALLEACADLVGLVLKFDHPADQVVSRFFREHREFGPRERATLAETVYTVLRKKLLFDHLSPSGSGPKERRMAILGFHGPRDFLKSALNDTEKRWLDNCDAVKQDDLLERHRHNLPEWLVTPLKAQLGDRVLAAGGKPAATRAAGPAGQRAHRQAAGGAEGTGHWRPSSPSPPRFLPGACASKASPP